MEEHTRRTTRRNTQSKSNGKKPKGPSKNKKNDKKENKKSNNAEGNGSSTDAICPYCSKSAENGTVVECKICDQWFHFECADIPEPLAVILLNDKNDQISWTCKECSRGAKKIMGHITKMTIKMAKQEEQISEINARLNRVEVAQNNPVGENPRLSKESIAKVVAEELDERRERELRKNNVIIHNIPESNEETPQENEQADENFIKRIADELTIEDIEISETKRIGAAGNKPRLVKVTLKSGPQRRELLQKAKNLRTTEEECLKKIFIVPDLSKRAREESKKLREELKRRRENGEMNLVISKGKITKKKIEEVKISEGEEEESDKSDSEDETETDENEEETDPAEPSTSVEEPGATTHPFPASDSSGPT